MKKGLLYCFLIMLTYGLSELGALALYGIKHGRFFSFEHIETQRKTISAEQLGQQAHQKAGDASGLRDAAVQKNFVLHPYQGFLFKADRPGYNKWGFLGESLPFDFSQHDPARRGQNDSDETNDVTVAITGGSVAHHFSEYGGREALLAYLRQLRHFQGKNVRLISLAVPGYKQPQQLISALYYLVLGGKLELLINLDGFNDVTGPIINWNQGIFPIYPWGFFWLPLTATVSEPAYLQTVGTLGVLQNLRRRVVHFFDPLCYSITASVLWDFLDAYLEQQIIQAYQDLSAYEIENQALRASFRSGPRETLTKEAAENLAVDVWLNTSVRLNNLAKTEGFHYFHFLQPNQYVEPVTKPFSEEEKKLFSEAWTVQVEAVRVGYPLLLKAQKKLQQNDVAFYNLTQVYRNVQETVYRDACCHVNTKGHELLGHAIGRRIRAYFKNNVENAIAE